MIELECLLEYIPYISYAVALASIVVGITETPQDEGLYKNLYTLIEKIALVTKKTKS